MLFPFLQVTPGIFVVLLLLVCSALHRALGNHSAATCGAAGRATLVLSCWKLVLVLGKLRQTPVVHNNAIQFGGEGRAPRVPAGW